MPFAGTDKIDPQISPLVQRQAAAAQSAIFLRSTSAWFNKDIDGTPYTISAPTREVGDTLYVLKAGFGQNIAAPTGWTALPAYTNNYLQIFRRVADGTASDDFSSTESSTRNVVGQMACFGNTEGETTALQIYQGGFLNNRSTGTDTDYDSFAINALGGADRRLLIAWGMREKNAALGAGAVSFDNDWLLDNEIGSIAYEQTTSPVGTIWAGWAWQFDETGNPAVAASTLTYNPLEQFCVETVQTQRLDF